MPMPKKAHSKKEADHLSHILSQDYKKILKKKLFLSVFSLILIFSLITIVTVLFFLNRIYPGVRVANIDLSFQDSYQARSSLVNTLNHRLSQTIILTYQPEASAKQQFSFNLTPSMVNIDVDKGLSLGFSFLHQKFSWPPPSIDLEISFNPTFDQQIDQIAEVVEKTPLDSQLSIDENGQIIVTPSQDGLMVNRNELRKVIDEYINTGKITSNTLPTKTLSPKLSYQTGLILKKRLDQIKLEPLKLSFKGESYELGLPTIISFIDLEKSTPSVLSGVVMGEKVNLEEIQIGNKEVTDNKFTLKSQVVEGFLKPIAENIDQPTQEPLFNFDPSSPNKVKEFRPPQEGRRLNIALTVEKIGDSLLKPDLKVVDLPVEITPPQNKLVNDLGIKELVATGVSNFAHSIENRIFNLSLAASRVNGVLIPPGQTFSFNQTVGDISAATGYKQAYVIKSGRTVLDDGGGVCQVSTTLFRAALNAGLPIVERTAHAYRVSYYEQGFSPGLDATTFYPSVDLKFKNDTPAHILIQTRVEGYTLYVDFYGTSDGRVAKITTPVIVSQTPPLPEIRQDDPTLPKGEIKQVDWAASGANVVFTRTVTRYGQTLINENIRSNYRPWQAVYLVGTKEN
jgi:vancomycin resistance protein YoaR